MHTRSRILGWWTINHCSYCCTRSARHGTLFPFSVLALILCLRANGRCRAVQARLCRKSCGHVIGLGPYLLSLTSLPFALAAVSGFPSFSFLLCALDKRTFCYSSLITLYPAPLSPLDDNSSIAWSVHVLVQYIKPNTWPSRLQSSLLGYFPGYTRLPLVIPMRPVVTPVPSASCFCFHLLSPHPAPAPAVFIDSQLHQLPPFLLPVPVPHPPSPTPSLEDPILSPQSTTTMLLDIPSDIPADDRPAFHQGRMASYPTRVAHHHPCLGPEPIVTESTRCFQCHAMGHFHIDCPEYECPCCHQRAPGHPQYRCVRNYCTYCRHFAHLACYCPDRRCALCDASDHLLVDCPFTEDPSPGVIFNERDPEGS